MTAPPRPLYDSFSDAGVYAALERGLVLVRARATAMGINLPPSPAWLFEHSFYEATRIVDSQETRRVVGAFRAIEARAIELLHEHPRVDATRWEMPGAATAALNLAERSPLHPWSADTNEAQRKMVVAAARVAVGAAIEATLAAHSLALLEHGETSQLARAYNDAHLIGVWTSAHAHTVANIQYGIETPSPPSLFTVPNALAEPDWSELLGKRFCAKVSGKITMPMLSILMRCTNPGARGWDSLVEASIAESVGVRHVITTAIAVCLASMHPFLHPAARPSWSVRMRTMHATDAFASEKREVAETITATSQFTKEAVRRVLASTLAATPALHDALRRIQHPTGHLVAPPQALPAAGMEAAMLAFAEAGVAMQAAPAGQTYTNAIQAAFARVVARSPEAPPQSDDEQPNGERGPPAKRKRRKRRNGHLVDANHPAQDPTDQPGVDPTTLARSAWDPSWLGKGTANTHQKVPLVDVTSDIWHMCFRVNFIAWWLHCNVNAQRMSRLDPVHYEAIHGLNAVTQLVAALPLSRALHAQRAALAHPSAGLLTISEVARELGIEGMRGTSTNGGCKNISDAINVLAASGSADAARMFAFARVAAISEKILTVKLGHRTTGLQLQSLARRLQRPNADSLAATAPEILGQPARAAEEVATLPVHATHLLVCCECHRVCNAHACEPAKAKSGSRAPFDELGVSSSMLAYDGGPHIRCSKRSSAALRNALEFEKQLKNTRLEEEPVDMRAVDALVEKSRTCRSASGDAGIAARIRRDAKSALEQRTCALACGERPCLRINLVGRAVRIFGNFYALCSLCGTVLQTHPHTRFGAEVCCLRCDAVMLGIPQPTADDASTRVCRYCGRVDDSTAKFRTFKAPHDISGRNRDLPPPLRTASFCPAHSKTWLGSALKNLESRVVLAHLALGAKPVYAMEQLKAGKSAGGTEKRTRRKR
jgi:hypothetical protein